MTPTARPRILIVDDDQALSAALAAFLKANGFDVFLAFDGTLAMKYARKEPVDLVVLDVGLPAGGGLFVLGNIRKLRAKDSLPIIVSTANMLDGIREHALEMGANDFLPKPYDLEVLLAKIRDHLPAKSGECS